MSLFFNVVVACCAAVLTVYFVRVLQAQADMGRYWLAHYKDRDRREAEAREKGFE